MSDWFKTRPWLVWSILIKLELFLTWIEEYRKFKLSSKWCSQWALARCLSHKYSGNTRSEYKEWISLALKISVGSSGDSSNHERIVKWSLLALESWLCKEEESHFLILRASKINFNLLKSMWIRYLEPNFFQTKETKSIKLGSVV